MEENKENVYVDFDGLNEKSKIEYLNDNEKNFVNDKNLVSKPIVSCFLIDEKNRQVATIITDSNKESAKKFDLVTTYVKNAEISATALARTINERLKIPKLGDWGDIIRALTFCGKVKPSDTEQAENKNDAGITVYALKVDDPNAIKLISKSTSKEKDENEEKDEEKYEEKYEEKNEDEDKERLVWLDYDKVKMAIKSSLFIFPYDKYDQDKFEKVFSNLDQILDGKDFFISSQEYENEYL